MRLALALALALVACQPDSPSGDDATQPSATADLANGYATDDPLAAGQRIFLEETFGTEVLGDWPPADFMLELMASEPEVFGDQFSAFGFLPDPGDDLPMGFKRGTADPTMVHETCGLCHIDDLADGTYWLGVPNRALDFGRFRVEVSRRWEAAGNPPLVSAEAEPKYLVPGPGRQRIESSDYPVAVPADLPPYFQLGARTAFNYMGTGMDLRSEVHFSIFAFDAGAPNAADAVVPFPDEQTVADLVAFMGSLDAPPPPAGDDGLISRGEQVFTEARCVDCHPHDISQVGVTPLDKADDGLDRLPGDDPAWPDGSVHTSKLHRVLQDGDEGDGPGFDQGLADLLAFIAANGLSVRPTDGYRANPLVGLAFTAPYLHNGSVPTLDDLLQPADLRPVVWDNQGFELDTTVAGNTNQGHEFGTTLSGEDKSALVAYLRSL